MEIRGSHLRSLASPPSQGSNRVHDFTEKKETGGKGYHALIICKNELRYIEDKGRWNLTRAKEYHLD